MLHGAVRFLVEKGDRAPRATCRVPSRTEDTKGQRARPVGASTDSLSPASGGGSSLFVARPFASRIRPRPPSPPSSNLGRRPPRSVTMPSAILGPSPIGAPSSAQRELRADGDLVVGERVRAAVRSSPFSSLSLSLSLPLSLSLSFSLSPSLSLSLTPPPLSPLLSLSLSRSLSPPHRPPLSPLLGPSPSLSLSLWWRSEAGGEALGGERINAKRDIPSGAGRRRRQSSLSNRVRRRDLDEIPSRVGESRGDEWV